MKPRTKKIIVALALLLLLAATLALFVVMRSDGEFSRTLKMRYYLSKTHRREPNVILITIDTLRQDHLSCYGYPWIRTPNLDDFFAEGVGFTNANTCVPLTLPSHVSILTGFYPTFHGVRDNGIYLLRKTGLTMTEALKARGYATGAFVSSFVLDKRSGLDKGFDAYNDDFSTSILTETHWELSPKDFPMHYEFYEQRADEVTKTALKWLEKNKDKKFFLWVHYFDPHVPYYGYSEDGSRIVARAPRKDVEEYSESYVRYATRLYDAEIVYTDFWIGKLLDTVSLWGLDPSSLTIITADHGESLGEHNYYFDHDAYLFDTMLKVPLMVRLPYSDSSGLVIDDLVRTIDIAPTVYDIIGIKPATKPNGTSLIPLIFGEKAKKPSEAYSETLHIVRRGSIQVAITNDHYKLIHNPLAKGSLLFDLKADPGENHNLLSEGSSDERLNSVAVDLLNRLNRVTASTRSTTPQEPEAIDEETAHKLKSLGYL